MSAPIDGLVIRTLRKDEWPIHKQVRLQALETDPAAFGSTLAQSLLIPDRSWIERTNNHCWIAFVDDHPSGIVRLWVEGEVWEIISMWVAPRARGRGVGKGLMRAAMDECRKHTQTAYLSVIETNEAAMDLYTSLGFVPTGPGEPNEHGLVEVRMRADLT